MTLLEVLIKARKRIDKPSKWCSYWSASEDGRRLGADGAVWWACDGDKALERQAMHALAEAGGLNHLWDDNSRVTYLGTHREVMAMFDKAIEVLSPEGER